MAILHLGCVLHLVLRSVGTGAARSQLSTSGLTRQANGSSALGRSRRGGGAWSRSGVGRYFWRRCTVAVAVGTAGKIPTLPLTHLCSPSHRTSEPAQLWRHPTSPPIPSQKGYLNPPPVPILSVQRSHVDNLRQSVVSWLSPACDEDSLSFFHCQHLLCLFHEMNGCCCHGVEPAWL